MFFNYQQYIIDNGRKDKLSICLFVELATDQPEYLTEMISAWLVANQCTDYKIYWFIWK